MFCNNNATHTAGIEKRVGNINARIYAKNPGFFTSLFGRQ
jgi:hypothetical protein